MNKPKITLVYLAVILPLSAISTHSFAVEGLSANVAVVSQYFFRGMHKQIQLRLVLGLTMK